MTSIMTNMPAMAALRTLRNTASNLASQQTLISTGLRVSTASDNAAYWSVATTMRSDRQAVSAANDALGLGAAKVDTAYSAMTAVVDVLSEVKAKLVAATEDGIDLNKIQDELDQLKQQVVAISQSASFNGQNWLNTKIDDIYDADTNKSSVVSGFTRNADGSVSVNSIDFSMLHSALFNSTGGGMLEADPRDLKTIGGLRFEYGNGLRSTSSLYNTGGSGPGDLLFDFSSPMTFGVGDSITFDVTVDADNPTDGMSPPYDLGKTSNITIDQSLVNTVLGRTDSTISTYKEYSAVLRAALAGSGLTTTVYTKYDPPGQTQTWVDIPDIVGIVHLGVAGKDGSSVAISNVSFNGVTGANQIADTSVQYGYTAKSMKLDFQPFTVYDEVSVSFRIRTSLSSMDVTFDSNFVNQTLGKSNGKVETSAEMATLLTAAIGRSDIIIQATDAGTVTLESDPILDRKGGEKSLIAIDRISVNIEPVPTMNFMEIDVAQSPDLLDGYIDYIETALGRVVAGASALGSLQSRIDMQSSFAKSMMASIDKGVSRLVDADMEDTSARLSALQTQQQLALQGLQMANQTPNQILTLFN